MPSPGAPAAPRLPVEDVYLELLADTLEGRHPRLVRFEFLRGNYQSIRRVTVRFGERVASGSGIAA